MQLACAPYRPDVIAHIPGVSAITVDFLSRRFDPKLKWRLPSALQNATEAHPPMRNREWWQLPFPNCPDAAEPEENMKATGKEEIADDAVFQ